MNPDYIKIAQSYGAKAFRIDSPNDLEGSLKEGLSTKGVVLMELIVDHTEMVYPMLTPGGTMDDMLLNSEDPVPDGPVLIWPRQFFNGQLNLPNAVKKSALMVYQNLKNITEEKEYWDKYIKFHELYWDGPNASQNVFMEMSTRNIDPHFQNI